MKYKNFSDFVDSFDECGDRTATTVKPFIKVHSQTYSEFKKQIYKSANYLAQNGIKKGDRVMVVAGNSPQWQELFLGCQMIGAILVPVDIRNSLETVLGFARQTTPKMLFRNKHILPKLDRKLIRAKILEDYNQTINDCSDKQPDVRLTGQEASVIIFTSGTTASPKGVVLTQRNILSNVEGVAKAIAISPNWRILSVLPLSHSYELTGECCMFSRGANICYLPRITPLAIVKALNEYHITTIVAVPQLLALFKQRIMQTAIVEKKDKVLNIALKLAPALPKKIRRVLFASVHKKLGGKLEVVITGGAPIPIDVAHFWEKMGVRALQGYGLTETSPILTVNKLNDNFRDSQGQALPGVKLKIAPDGEILAKGPGIFKEYWQNEEQTKKAFDKDGWFRTGDMGKIDEQGWLKIQGRAKFMIVLPSGLNVFPEDIELVAEKHHHIKEICVVGVKRAGLEEVFAAVISDKNDKKIIKAIKEINDKLEEFQHISNWMRWPEEQFPRTLLLKIDRKTIQNWANQEFKEQVKKDSKDTDSQDPLVNILKLSLDEPRAVITEKDRLADIGIDSLRRLTVISLIEEQLGVNIPESKISKTTTLGQLRKLVTQSVHSESDNKRSSWQYRKTTRFVGACLRESVIRLLLASCVKIKVEGSENIKEIKHPAIYIFNHVDALDVPVIYQSLPHNDRNHLSVAAANDMLERHKLLTLGSRLVYASFNLDRQENILSSLEYTAALLDKGWSVAIAPEGQVSKNGKLQHFKSGIGLLAVETGLPIVPIKSFNLAGTLPLDKKWPQKFSKVVIKIGKPTSYDGSVSYERASKKLYKIMKRL